MSKHDVWPSDFAADLENVKVAIARTEPRYEDSDETREVERLYLDSIAAARASIYVENQYLTSESIGKALCQRLAEAQGPEIVMVLPRATSGWLEQNTMDVLRARQLAKMRRADRHGRLKVYCPEIPGLNDECLTVHAKVMVVDDALARVGSANLSNRSMGLDTECDIVIEAGGDEAAARAIARLRNRLLGEHLNVAPESVAQTLGREGSLIKAIETLRGGERTLKELDGSVSESIDQLIPEHAIIDPERPVDAEEFASRFIHEEQRRPASRYVLRIVLLLIMLLALAAAWRWTPLSTWLNPEKLAASLGVLQQSPTAPIIVIAAYALGGIISFPVTFLILATGLLFGPFLGFVYASLGSLLSAAVTYGMGAAFGRDAIDRFAGKRFDRVNRALRKRGVLAIVTLRVFPVAPYTVINVVAGAAHIRFRDYMLGTALGMTPGTLMLLVFVDQVWNVIRNPSPAHVGIAAAVVLTITAVGLLLRRWLRGKEGNGGD